MKKFILGGLVLALSAGRTIASFCRISREEVIQQIVPSAVQIVLERDGKRYWSGSGVAVAARSSPQGVECLVLTGGHTLSQRSEKDRISILFGRHHGAGTKAPAVLVVHRDTAAMDLALLRATSGECVPGQFGNPPFLGDAIWVAACPWGRNMTLMSGIVGQVNADPPGDPAASPRRIVDASVSYGFSGGGVYDAEGRLVGIVEGYRMARVAFEGAATPQYVNLPVPGETYVVPLADIRRFLRDVDESEMADRVPAVTGSGS